jgi:hypothetical protein
MEGCPGYQPAGFIGVGIDIHNKLADKTRPLAYRRDT